MHVETYSAFLTPRDKEPSLSSSEEKSSKFGEQENENEREGKKQSKALYILYIYISISRWITWSIENKLPRAIYKENYKTKYLRLFTPFPNLITKESYNWWLTRRKWGFRHQKSEAKYPKVSVATIGKLQENTRALCKMAAKFSQQKADFAAVQKYSFSLEWSFCNGCNSFISTPNRAPFEALDFWLPELRNDI